MQKWDGMLQSIHFLDRAIHAYPILSTGCFINTYGLPGMAWLFNDRQFLCHAVSAHFPDGTRALAVYTPKDPHPADPGTGAKSRTVRAHMGVSGYVVSPHAGEERRLLGPDRCQITMVLQMDPKVRQQDSHWCDRIDATMAPPSGINSEHPANILQLP
jgi:START domain